MGAALAVVGIGAALFGGSQQRKARKAQEAANARSQRVEAIRSSRARVQAIRQSRFQAASVQARAGSAGLSSASGVQGAIGGLGTDLASQVQTSQAIETLSTQRIGFLNQAARFQERAQFASALSGAAMGAGGNAKVAQWIS